jgi:hypothetical protein
MSKTDGPFPIDCWLRRLRPDWDEIVRDVLPAPDCSTYMLGANGTTKLVGGIGTYYDATSLQFLTSPLTGQRLDYFL